MTLSEIAVRSAVLWIVGEFGLGVLSALAANRKPTFFWFIGFMALKTCLLVACFGVGLFLREATYGPDGLGPLVCGAGFVVSGWFSFVVLQFVQNYFYSLVDVRPQQIRWFGWSREKRKRYSRTSGMGRKRNVR